MPSASGLTPVQRVRCRDRVVQAAKLSLANKDQVSYTEGPKRWNGIKNRRNAAHGQVAHFGDCSSSCAWWLWSGLHLLFGLGDVVNGTNWTGGFTGTMYNHGMVVQDPKNALRGDCVLYGKPPGKHVAMVVGMTNGVPMVISHGSEPGPFYLRFDYRPDAHQIRRYI